MTNDPWFWSTIAVVAFCAVREVHFRSVSRSNSQILRVVRGACKQLSDLKQLCLDIESRSKLDRIQESLRQAGRIEIHGGQNNVGNTDIGGDQRQL